MITEKEKLIIKKTLGNHYTKSVLNELARKKIFNAKDEAYSSNNIRSIASGLIENERVELAILNLVKRTINKQKKQAEKRKMILQ